MATRERLIIDAVLAALRNAPNIPGVPSSRVHEERGFAFEARELPALDVEPGSSAAREQGIRSAVTLHTLEITVHVLAMSSAADSPGRVADPIVAAVYRTMLADDGLRQLIRWITYVSSRIERESTGSGVLARRSMLFAIDYTAATADMEVAA